MCQCGQKTDLVPCLAGAECGPGFARFVCVSSDFLVKELSQ